MLYELKTELPRAVNIDSIRFMGTWENKGGHFALFINEEQYWYGTNKVNRDLDYKYILNYAHTISS